MSDLLDFQALYPVPVIRCRRIVRTSEEWLGDLQLNADTAAELGKGNIGVFAGRCPSISNLLNRFEKLTAVELPGWITVALSTKKLADEYRRALPPSDHRDDSEDAWRVGSVIFTTPEKLRSIDNTQFAAKPIIAVGLVDPKGIVHQARGGSGTYRFNDRPQHLAKFRAAHEIGFWRPPFFLFTEKPAKALGTDQMLTPYSLDAWHFIDGSALRMGPPPPTSSTEVPESHFHYNFDPNDVVTLTK